MSKPRAGAPHLSRRFLFRSGATAATAVTLTAVAVVAPLSASCYATAAPLAQNGATANADGALVRVTPADCATFETTFASLARQADALFVAEGVPAHEKGIAVLAPNAGKPTLDDTIKTLAAREQGVPLMEAVGKVAEAFDYEASWGRGGAAGRIVLLRKRYSVPGDLPCVTIGETMAAIRDIQKIIKNFDPRPAYERGKIRTAERDVIASLTDTQIFKMGLADGLPVSSMPVAQRKLIYKMGVSEFLSTPLQDYSFTIAGLGRINENLPFCIADFEMKGFPPVKVFGYRTANETVLPVQPMSRSDIFVVSPGSVMRFTGRNGQPLISKDWTNPTDEERLMLEAAPARYGITLQTIIASLTASEGSGAAPSVTGGGGSPLTAPTVTAEETLNEKIITVIDDKGALGNRTEAEQSVALRGAVTKRALQSLLQAVADVYDLRLFGGEQNRYFGFERSKTRLPDRYEDARDEMLRALTAPYLRAYRGNKGFHQAALEASDKKKSTDQKSALSGRPLNNDFLRFRYGNTPEEQREEMSALNSNGVMRRYAVRRLRFLMEPRLKEPTDEILLKNATPEERRLFAVYTLAGFMTIVHPMAEKPLPDYLARFESARLTGERRSGRNGERLLAFRLQGRDAAGAWGAAVGTAGTAVDAESQRLMQEGEKRETEMRLRYLRNGQQPPPP